MNPNELRSLLKAVAVSDKRTTGTDDLDYWARMAQEGRWTFATAMRALIIFRDSRPGQWLEPGNITEIIRDARRKAAETFMVPKEPDGIRNADLPAWHRAQLAAHQDRLLAVWCSGGDIPVAPSAAQITTGNAALTTGMDLTTCPPGLKEHVAECLQRVGREKPSRRRLAVPLPRSVPDDDARRVQARAELDAKRRELAES